MFQVHVQRHISFENAEPPKRIKAEAGGEAGGKKPEAGGKKRKKRKKLPPLEHHLNKLRNALNKAIRDSKGIYSEGLTSTMHVYKEMLKKTRKDPSGSHAVLSMIKHDLDEAASAGLEEFELLEPFMHLLEKPLPSDLGSLDPKSRVSGDLTIKIPKKHVTGPSAPRAGAASKPAAATPVGLTIKIPKELVTGPSAPRTGAASKPAATPVEEEEDPTKECGHRGKCKCSDRDRPRRQRKQVLEPGKRYLVTLKHHTGKDNKVARLIKCGPRQLVLTGVGTTTLSFIVKEKGIKSTTDTILRDDVDVEPITGVSEPSQLLPQMLLEMHWEGDPKWHDVRYTPGLDGQQAVTLISNAELVDFNEEDDEWIWPQYPMLDLEDKVIILDMDDARVATITDIGDNDHTYICEWDDKKKGEPRNFEIDVWYERVRGVLAADVSEEVQLDEEEEDDGADHDVGDEVFYKNRAYLVRSVEETDDIVYTLENPDDEEDVIVRTQTELGQDWIPKFGIGDGIIYNGLPGTITDIDFDESAYEVTMDDGDIAFPKSPNELSLLQPLSLGEGSVVFYNYGFYKIVSNRVTYTLKPEEGDGPEVEGVTQHDLDDWVLYVSGGKWQIYHVEDTQMKNVTRTVKGNKVKVQKLHYKVRGEDGKSKWILYNPTKFKDQDDANFYFEDAMNDDDDDDLDTVLKFEVGERVIVILDSNTTKVGEIVSHIPGEELDQKKYEVRIGDAVQVFAVGQIDKLVVEEEEEDDFLGDRETDENGICWEVTRFEDGKAVWEVFTVEDVEDDTDDSDDSDDDAVAESDFNVDDYVTIDEEGAVYQITKAFNNVYEVIPEWGMDGTKISGLPVGDLTLYEPTFSVGDHVLFDGAKCKVTEVDNNGYYTLDNDEQVTENKLENFFETLKGVVRVNGTKEVFKVIKYKDGEYDLKNVVDGSEIKADKDMVDLKENSEFDVGDYVQLCSERYPRKVNSVNSRKYTYKLEGLPEREFRESELAEPRYEPKFEEGDTVRIGSGGKVFTIKKVIRGEGSYILNDRSKHHEDVLEEVEDED